MSRAPLLRRQHYRNSFRLRSLFTVQVIKRPACFLWLLLCVSASGDAGCTVTDIRINMMGELGLCKDCTVFMDGNS